MSRRTQQIASTMMRALQQRLARGLADPRMRGLVTITGVDVAEDLEQATVRVTVMPEEHEALTLHALSSAAGKLRRELADEVRIRQMPVLRFVVDEGLKEQAKVLALLAKDRAEREAREAAKAREGGA